MRLEEIDKSHVLEEEDFMEPHDGWICLVCKHITCRNCKKGAGIDDAEMEAPCIGYDYMLDYDGEGV